MRYTPIFVPAILALMIIAVTIYKPHADVAPVRASKVTTLIHQTPQDGDFLQNLTPILKNAKTVSVFKFPQPCQKCQEANLSRRDFPTLPPTTELSKEDAGFFLGKLADRGSYILGPQKAMPFFADHGFVLVDQSGASRLLLLSTFSQSLRLVGDSPGPVLIGNIDPLFPEMTKRLERILGKNQRG